MAVVILAREKTEFAARYRVSRAGRKRPH